MSQVKIYLLGVPQVERDGAMVSTDRRKAIALLAYLAITSQPHNRDTLATLLWPDYDTSSSYAYLRRTLWEINQTLGPGWLETERDQVWLKQDGSLWVDAAAFQHTLAHFRQSSTGLDALAEAVTLYRDHFLAGFSLRDSESFDTWQQFHTEHFRRELAWALEQLAAGYAEQAAWETALSYAQRWLALDPLQEAAHRQLMRLYTARGDRAAAIRQYESCAHLLKTELGLTPSDDTAALWQEIRTGYQSQRLRPTSPRPVVASAAGHNLPTPPTPFVGRKSELAEIEHLLTTPECRLLTLVGPGGTGKTRLAIQAAADALTHNSPWRDGVVFVPLAPLSSSDSLVPTLASALGFQFYKEGHEEPRLQLLDYVRQKQMLLVLDNVEHLLDEQTARLCSDILAAAPELKLLATSRSRLNVRGEQLYQVAGMRWPKAGQAAPNAAAYSAIQLFRQSAERVQPGFQLGPDNIGDIVRICALVDGTPLALELAAAWLELLTPAEIAREIERSLDFLATDLHDVPERQRSIRAVFLSSWQLLSEEERQVFQQLTVFWGGFTHEAAQAVSGASLRTLLGLVNKSWLQRDERGRYQIHFLLLQYGYEELRRHESLWRKAKDYHAAYFITWLTGRGRAMAGPQQKEAYETVALELENIRSAWHWCVEQGRFEPLVHEPLLALLRFAIVRSVSDELIPLVDFALNHLPEPPLGDMKRPLYLMLLVAQAMLWFESWFAFAKTQEAVRRVLTINSREGLLPDHDPYILMALSLSAWVENRTEGIARLEATLPALQAEGNVRWQAWVTRALGQLWGSLQEREKARHYFAAALTLFDSLGDDFERGLTFSEMAGIAREMGDYDETMRLFQAALALYERAGNQVGIGFILSYGLNEIYIQQGQFEKAFASMDEGRRIFNTIGNVRLIANTYHWESLFALRHSTPEHALQTRDQQLQMARRLGRVDELGWGLWELGEIQRVMGDVAAARQTYDEAMTLFDDHRDNLGVAFYHRGLADLALMQGDTATARKESTLYLRLARLGHHGWSVAYAQCQLGQAALLEGKLDEARPQLLDSVRVAHELGNRDLCLKPLTVLAQLALQRGDGNAAATLSTFVAQHPLTWWEVRQVAQRVLDEAGDGKPTPLPTLEDAIALAQTLP